ncbi:MAG: MMPL family transporter [Candidatus Marinimicrobia bacterium]|nr:MMPL family transporter [Candidatus Neomarinimicrobiota bacterium]
MKRAKFMNLRYIRFTNLMEKRKKLYFTLFIVLMVFATVGIFRVNSDSNLLIFMPNHSPSKTIFDEMNVIFENEDELIVLLHTGKDSLDADIQNTVIELHDTLVSLPCIAYIVSPVMNHEFIEMNLVEDFASAKFHNGEWKIFLSLFADSTINRKAIEQIDNILDDSGIPYNVSGTAYIQKRVVDIVTTVTTYLPLIAIFLVMLIFRFQMRSWKATFLSIVPALVGAIWVMGLLGWIGEDVSIITAIAPLFTLIIGSADGLHFVSHYLESRAEGRTQKDAVGRTLHLVGIPMVITTVTSAGGFLSLLVMDTNAVRELAFFSSAGIAFAGIATWFILPLFLINFIDFKKEKIRPPRFDGHFFKKFWGWPSVVIALLVIGAAFLGFRNVQTDFNQLSLFKESTDVIENAEAITEVQGGSMPLYVFVKHENNILDTDLRANIATLTDTLRTYGGVISPYEIVDGIMNQPAMRMMRYFSPERAILSDFLDQNNMPLKHMVNLDNEALKITVLPREITTDYLIELRDVVENIPNENAQIDITGMSYIMEDLNRGMVRNLKNTLIVSVFVMLMLLLITFRRLRPSIFSLIPVIITSWFLYGFLGLSGIHLTVISSLIFSIAMGINVDYAIHLTSVSLELKSLDKGFAYAVRPIVSNAVGLAVGMSVLFFTPLTVHRDITILMWVSMLMSMFLSLTLLPTILKWYFQIKGKKAANA